MRDVDRGVPRSHVPRNREPEQLDDPHDERPLPLGRVAIPVREILMQVIQTSRRWLAFITASVILAIGAFYELIEWWVAILATPNLGDKFLGTQGDIWDTQWDMFLALVGAILTLAIFGKWHDRELRKE